MKFVGSTTRALAGSSLAALDFDGDTKDDLAMGAPKDATGEHNGGAVHLFLGGQILGSTEVLSIGNTDASWFGTWGDLVGSSVANGGDLNNDGDDDLLIGAQKHSSAGYRSGTVFVMFGGGALSSDYVTNAFDLMLAGPSAGAEAGVSVAGNTDLNNDGNVDIVIGALKAGGVQNSAGAAFVMYGPFAPGSDSLANADAKLRGAQKNEYAGATLATFGDINNDGFGDLAVGAWRAQAGLKRDGRISLFFGGEDTADEEQYYLDTDGDGFGDNATGVPSCTPLAGRILIGDDCDDGANDRYPGADESICNGTDYNCDGFSGATDNDGDGYQACNDCDDGNPAVSPAASEVCDGIDNNCANGADESTALDAMTWYYDNDGDTYGFDALPLPGCEQPDLPGNLIMAGGDCDDTNPNVNIGASEFCDAIDNDCDNTIDEPDAIDAVAWYVDSDGDGFGDGSGAEINDNAQEVASFGCSAPAGYLADNTDCDDDDPNIKPGAVETCDGRDNDCDGLNYIGGQKSLDEADVALAGSQAWGRLGQKALFLPDQNADGFDEIVIGAPGDDNQATAGGAVYVVAGDANAVHVDVLTPHADGSQKWLARIGADRLDSEFGSSIAVGDANNDGVADLLIGAPYDRNGGASAGRVSLFYGPLTGDLDQGDADVNFVGENGMLFGWDVALVDLDGDGNDDTVISARGFNATQTEAGAAFIFYSDDGTSQKLHTDADAQINGTSQKQKLSILANLGDINNDTYDDLGMGSPEANNTKGQFDILYGAATQKSGAVASDATWTGSAGLDKVGYAIAGGGDSNGDSIDDVLLGSDNGQVWLVHGSGTLPASGAIETLANATFVGLTSQKAGRSVAFAGDVNNDTYDDLLIGAPGDDTVDRNAGAVFLVYGGQNWAAYDNGDGDVELENSQHFGFTDELGSDITAQLQGVQEGAKLFGTAFSDEAGSDVSGGGDANGDGIADILIGVPNLDDDNNSDVGGVIIEFGGEYGTDIGAVDAHQRDRQRPRRVRQQRHDHHRVPTARRASWRRQPAVRRPVRGAGLQRW